jgi:large subunit ribosomal protein L7A
VLEELKQTRSRVVGTKEVRKHLERGEVARLFVAEDAEQRVTAQLLQEAERRGVAVERVPTMAELGRACGIQVGAASAALLRDSG